MKKHYQLIILLIVLGLFTACKEKEDDPKITISNSEFTVGAEQDSEAKATFSVNVDWTTSIISYEGDTKDWLTITPVAGKAGTDQTITMKASANPAEIARTASFTINYGGKPHKLTITQLGNTVEPTITISTSEFILDAEKDSEATATFSIDVDWTTDISYEGTEKDWLTVTPTTGDAGIDQTLTMGAKASPTTTKRKAYVTIKYGVDKEHKLTITQLKDIDITKHFDADFAARLQENGYITDATKILLSEVISITEIEVKTKPEETDGLISLSGIEYFEALTNLDCSINLLTILDLSENTALTILHCDNNRLTTLDLSKNTALTYLRCSSNELTALDMSKNTALTSLICGENKLITLNVSKSNALTNLACSFNQLPSLNVSNNTALTEIQCHTNKISVLDLSKNTVLKTLYCGDNQIGTIDVSKNTALTYLGVHNNKLTGLDVGKNTALTHLVCLDNPLGTLDVSKNTALTNLLCVNNKLKSLALNTNTLLKSLTCFDNELTALDLSKNTELLDVNCSKNPLISLDLSKNVALMDMRCYNTQITSLDVSQNTALKLLYCNANKLTSMDVSKNTAMGKFYYHNNPGSENKFVVKAWFNSSSIPDGFPAATHSWKFEGQTITVDYQKVI